MSGFFDISDEDYNLKKRIISTILLQSQILRFLHS